ncbi:MAG: MBOAT family protein [Lachnospiraceae bacterium]|nr:MBOAT family protein [Lachnospiraceae bacterium]
MLFTGILFLFRFLPIFFLIYLLAGPRYRGVILVVGSLLYYAALEPRFVFLLIGMSLLNWLFAQEKSRLRTVLLILLDLGLLVSVKLIVAANAWEGLSAIPLGMSFYLLKMISFQADLHRGRIREKPSLMETAGYFVMFPQLLQGPIMRYEQQFSEEGETERGINPERAEDGLMLLLSGLVMKVLLADEFAAFFARLTRIGYESISTPLAWMGIYGYSLQLYFDFWGYSLMAAGLLMLLGYPYIENFHHPYAAASVSDFYRRWHVTLGRFFRDYVYIPLGGSRVGKARCFCNLLFVWALTGFWHGQGWNYLIWALFLFLVICWEKFAIPNFLKKVPVWGRVHVLLLIPISWILFAITDLPSLGAYLLRLFPLWQIDGNVNPGDWILPLQACALEFILGAVLLIPKTTAFLVEKRHHIVIKLLLLVLFWFAIQRICQNGENPFLYLQF